MAFSEVSPLLPKNDLVCSQISENPHCDEIFHSISISFPSVCVLRWCFVNIGGSGEPLMLLSHKRRSEHIKSLVELPKLYSY